MSSDHEPLRIVIVGGVAGGASAAARARRANANAEITILEKGPAVSFANCGLPYHLGGEIEHREHLLVASAELFWNRFRVRVRTGHEVLAIDRAAQTITGQATAENEVEGREFKVPYDRLILATGSEPIRPPFMDKPADNVFQLWNLTDLDAILGYMKNRACKKATVVGAGFVGLEVVEQLVRRKIAVSLVERMPQVLSPVDEEIAKQVQLELQKHNVGLHLKASVEELLSSQQRVTALKLSTGQSVPADVVIVGAGVRPRTELAEQAGLTLGEHGGVAINEYCQTNDPKIYAVGDMVEYEWGALGGKARIPLAGPANRSGRVAGAHAATGRCRPLGAMQGTAIVRVFGVSVGATGLNERICRRQGLEYRTATIQAPHHASYFPGAKLLTLKIVYDRQGRVLGAQAIGAEGVDKRLDVVASVLQFRGSIDDLADLDLAYAPPFGSAKDPLHMAAFVAQNDLASWPELVPYDHDLDGLQVVDVRSESELQKLPLPGAIHIPIDQLAERWEELDPQLSTITVCHSGKRAHVAACWLRGKGFQSVCNLSGGVSVRSKMMTATDNALAATGRGS